ncbi:serine hydrolase [Streptomyces sp. DH12]|uniref:serine hydrolase domain-containing protein n=1 Tax=Streptomyces sp. DH12 TaxID=2857010 RepID=UPI001E616E35|nr:serine hydrolase domain-containing protein [Streptomyces sp. DH12]
MTQDPGVLARQTAEQLAEDGVGAVVAAVVDGRAEIRGAGRVASDRPDVPGADTLFEIGSVTKVFTALCLARLAVAGTVDLDEPLAGLLPEGTVVPSREGAEITLRHLATHTSGLPRLPKGMLLRTRLRPNAPDPYARCTARVLLRGLARTRLDARPGARFQYSNLGAGLLGLALARRAGTDYPSLVRREVCAPLGLADTVVTVGADRADRLARGHDGDGRPTRPWHLADLAGAGALRSTASDLVTFVLAQWDASGPLAEAVRLSRETRHPTGPSSWAHLGWVGHRPDPRQGGRPQIWHNGGTGGFSSFVGFDPDRRTAVVALANTRSPVDAAAARLLATLQTGHAAPARP